MLPDYFENMRKSTLSDKMIPVELTEVGVFTFQTNMEVNFDNLRILHLNKLIINNYTANPLKFGERDFLDNFEFI